MNNDPQPQHPQQAPPAAQYPYMYQAPPEDEIDLLDLFLVLLSRWKTIALVTVLATSLAVAYALLAPSVYKAEAIFLPPAASDIQALKVKAINGDQANEDVSVASVYALFKQNLQAVEVKKTIFKEMNLLEQFAPQKDENVNADTIFDKYSKSITVTFPKPTKDGDVFLTSTLSMEGEDPVLVAEIANRLGEEARRVTAAEVLLNLQAKVNARIKDLNQEIQLLREKTIKHRLDEVERLETADVLKRKTITDKIAALRVSAKKKRLDRIATLREAAGIAHSLGNKDPIRDKLDKISGVSPGTTQIMTDLTTPAPQLYTLGFEALEAEIQSLSARTSDDPFIPELRDLEEQLAILEHNRKVEQLKSRKNDDPFIEPLRDKENELAYLESIQIDPRTVITARLDQAAFPPERRIKPKRPLVVALGLVIGLMGGIFLAFFMNFVASAKARSVPEEA